MVLTTNQILGDGLNIPTHASINWPQKNTIVVGKLEFNKFPILEPTKTGFQLLNLHVFDVAKFEELQHLPKSTTTGIRGNRRTGSRYILSAKGNRRDISTTKSISSFAPKSMHSVNAKSKHERATVSDMFHISISSTGAWSRRGFRGWIKVLGSIGSSAQAQRWHPTLNFRGNARK